MPSLPRCLLRPRPAGRRLPAGRRRGITPALLVLVWAAIPLALGAGGCGKADTGVQLVYAYVGSFAGRGTQPDSLAGPTAVGVLGDGLLIREVWVAEDDSDRVSAFDFLGTYRRTLRAPGEFLKPVGLAVVDDSTVVVLEEDGLRASVVDTSGAVRRTIPLRPGTDPAAVAVRGREVFVGCSDPDQGGGGDVFSVDGTLLRTVASGFRDSLFSIGGLAVSESLVFVTDPYRSRVRVFRPGGGLVRSFGAPGSGSGQMNSPQGLALTDDGRLLVVDQGNRRVQEYGQDGKFVTQFGKDQLGNPASFRPGGIAAYSSSVLVGEYVYVTDAAANRVYIVVRRFIRSTDRPALVRPR